MKKFLFFALALAFFFCPAFAVAAGNVTELKIKSINTPVKAGGRLDFSFSAGNMSGPACSAQLVYWFGSDSEKLVQGSDNFYLKTGEVVSEDVSLIMPSDLKGVKTLFLEMLCNDSSILASRVIEISRELPAMPLFSDVVIDESGEGKQIEFSYTIKSSQSGLVPFKVEEQISKDGAVVWHASQDVPVDGSASLKRFGPVLSLGTYTLVVKAVHGAESAEIAREFAVAPLPFPLLQVITAAALLLLLFSAVFITARFIAPRTILSRQPVVPAETAFKAEKPLKKILKPVVQRLLLFESQSSGIPDEVEISRLLDGAGLKGAERKNALDSFVGRVQLQQTVKCYVVGRKERSSGFETVVSFVVANNTNRNWLNMVILARLPKFLGSNVLSMASDAKTVVERYGGILQFTLKKVRAMQSATVSYSFDRLISQPEANTVPLPVVISFGESEPLVITEVREENPIVLEAGEGESSENELNVVAVKKAVKRVRAAKKLGKGRQSITN